VTLRERSSRVVATISVVLVVALLVGEWILLHSGSGEPSAPGATPQASDTTVPQLLEVGREPILRVDAAPLSPTTSDELVVHVRDYTWHSVAGAHIAVGGIIDDQWESTILGTTGVNGTIRVAYPAADLGRDVAVFAAGYGAWFGRDCLPKVGNELDVTLPRSSSVAGRVVTQAGIAVSGVQVVCLAQHNKWWAAPEFVADTALPSLDSCLAPPDRSTYVQKAVSGQNGEFEFSGVAADWHNVITLVDDSWILNPASMRIDAALCSLLLVAHRATGIDIHTITNLGEAEALISATSSEWSRSFSIAVRGSCAKLRFLAPEGAKGSIEYSAKIFVEGQHRAIGEGAAPAGFIANVQTRDVSGGAVHRILAQWPDGSLCDRGILTIARDKNATPVAAKVVEQGSGRYLVECGSNATEIAVLARDCCQDLANAPVLPLGRAAADQWQSVIMPPGSDVVILAPGAGPSSVTFETESGARVITVMGLLRLRSASPGVIRASMMRDGIMHKVDGRVSPGEETVLDLSR
jgi:hypothetical protein